MHDAGKVVPAIRDRPSPRGFEWLWQAFTDLNSCRAYGMSPGPIPWTAIQQYAESNSMGVDDTWLLHRVIRAVDNVWLDQRTQQQQQAKPAKKPAGGTRGRP